MIVINFKTYPQITQGNGIINMAKQAEEVFAQYQVPIILAVQATDIYKLAKATHLPVFAQHIDPFEPEKSTGFTTWMAVKEAGAVGTLINHSEHRIGMENIEKTIKICQAHGLQTCVCVENSTEASQVDKFNPDMIALEDPILIGGDVSIVANDAGKKQVEEFTSLGLKAKLLVGAGVKTKIDITTSLELKASGVLLASGVTKAADPKAVMIDLCQGFKK